MKTLGKNQRRAFISMALVMSVGLVVAAGLAFAYRHHIRSLETQAKSQVKIDYAQKEDAILRALIHIVPNKAIGAMQEGSAGSEADYLWTTIFEEAIDLANAETAIDATMMASLGNANLISANTGDTSFADSTDIVEAIKGNSGYVNPGVTQESSLLLDANIGPKLPAPLETSWSVFRDDEDFPVISTQKTHSTSWTKGIHLAADQYPLYNLLNYPNIRFGYARPGDLFVAKRNWWAFTLKFGESDADQTGLNIIEKNYLLSIYEVPSQLPMSASGFMSVGKHEDGTSWASADLSGGVFAGRLETQGTVALTDGLFSARQSTAFSGDTTVAGRSVNDNFDALGVRELREATTGSNFHDASLAGNTGRVAFIPFNRGNEFLKLHTDGSSGSRLSPTGWNAYTTGAIQANMRLMIWQMDDIDNQIPTALYFVYRNNSGGWSGRILWRGNDLYPWPSDSQTGGVDYPFQTTWLDVGRRALLLHMDRLPAYLASLGDAADLTVNNSLYIYPEVYYSGTVKEPNIPSTDEDCSVSVRGGEDLSMFSEGFSLVTDLRLYLGSSLNAVPIPPPAGSGIPAGVEYFPPVSLFAPEKRFGTDASFNHPVEFKGQLNSLKTGVNDVFRPLDLKSGSDDAVKPDLIDADLKMLRSPAELPPIHFMNWLVTVEEIHKGP